MRMMLRTIVGSAIVLMLGWTGSVSAQAGAEYRAVTLADGTTFRGSVVQVDGSSLTVRTLDGDKIIPLDQIAGIEPISKEQYLKDEGRRLIYLPLNASNADAELAVQIDQKMLEALARDDLVIVPLSELNPATIKHMESCGDFFCQLEALRAEQAIVVHGWLELQGTRHRLTLRRYDRSLRQVSEVAVQLSANQPYVDMLNTSASVLLGEKQSGPRSQPPDTTPDSAASTPATHDPQSAPSTLDLTTLVPIPGYPSLVAEDISGVAGAAASSLFVTAAAVYIVGDTTAVGAGHPMRVPWTFEESRGRNVALLGGVGVLSYLATTWIVNQISERRVEKHGK